MPVKVTRRSGPHQVVCGETQKDVDMTALTLGLTTTFRFSSSLFLQDCHVFLFLIFGLGADKERRQFS